MHAKAGTYERETVGPRPLPQLAAAANMVRNYIRKGGHGGRRDGAGLAAGFWEAQGGRKAAAAAKKQRKAEADAKAAVQKQRWQQWQSNHSVAAEQQCEQHQRTEESAEKQTQQAAPQAQPLGEL